jgi:hypothetical protein
VKTISAHAKRTELMFRILKKNSSLDTSVADPDPHVFGPPGSGSISQRYGSGFGSGFVSGSGSYDHQAKIVRKT